MWPVSPPSSSLTSQFFHARYKPEYFFSFSFFSPFLFFGPREASVILPSADSASKHVVEEAAVSVWPRCVSHGTCSRSESRPCQKRRAALVTQVAGERPRPQGCKVSPPRHLCWSNKTQQGDPCPWHSALILGQISSHLDTFKVSAQDGADDPISIYRHGESG